MNGKRFRRAFVMALCAAGCSVALAQEVRDTGALAGRAETMNPSPQAAVNCLWSGDWDSNFGVIDHEQRKLYS